MQLWQYCLLVTARLHVSDAFLRPSSQVLKTVVAATGACHGSGWYISSEDVRGRLPLHYVIAYLGYDIVQWQPTSDSLTTVFSTPDDGRKKHPKHVE